MPKRIPTTEDLAVAAKAVRDAVVEHEAKPRARKQRHINAWKGVAAEALGMKRLTEQRFFEVLKHGKTLNLFKIKGTKDHPYIVPTDPPDPLGVGAVQGDAKQPEFEDEQSEPPEPKPILAGPCMSQEEWDAFVEAEQAKSLLPEGFGPEWPKTPPRIMPTPLKHPDERKYAYHLECGHMSGSLRKRKLEDGTEEIYCQACELKTPADHRWMSENRGVPIPVKRRRSEANPSGLCCNKEGQYIGGLEGDCRYRAMKNKKAKVCEYHKDKPLWGAKAAKG